jgi:hypothetical protein
MSASSIGRLGHGFFMSNASMLECAPHAPSKRAMRREMNQMSLATMNGRHRTAPRKSFAFHSSTPFHDTRARAMQRGDGQSEAKMTTVSEKCFRLAGQNKCNVNR